jgi:hypothetical protein
MHWRLKKLLEQRRKREEEEKEVKKIDELWTARETDLGRYTERF